VPVIGGDRDRLLDGNGGVRDRDRLLDGNGGVRDRDRLLDGNGGVRLCGGDLERDLFLDALPVLVEVVLEATVLGAATINSSSWVTSSPHTCIVFSLSFSIKSSLMFCISILSGRFLNAWVI
jgi:hypothetical protein